MVRASPAAASTYRRKKKTDSRINPPATSTGVRCSGNMDGNLEPVAISNALKGRRKDRNFEIRATTEQVAAQIVAAPRRPTMELASASRPDRKSVVWERV